MISHSIEILMAEGLQEMARVLILRMKGCLILASSQPLPWDLITLHDITSMTHR